MFKKKEKLDITPETPEYTVKYIGKTETFKSGGKGCTSKPVQHIWDNAEEERLLHRVRLFVTTTGIVLRDYDNSKKEERFPIRHVSYCCAEQGVHGRVFTWISKNELAKKLECHAVLCANKEKAQGIAVNMSRAFQLAYKDWKTDKERVARLSRTSESDQSRTSTSDVSRNTSSVSDSSRQSDHSSQSGNLSPVFSDVAPVFNGNLSPVFSADRSHKLDEFFFAHDQLEGLNRIENNNINIRG